MVFLMIQNLNIYNFIHLNIISKLTLIYKLLGFQN
jgi:hypothetical protein